MSPYRTAGRLVGPRETTSLADELKQITLDAREARARSVDKFLTEQTHAIDNALRAHAAKGHRGVKLNTLHEELKLVHQWFGEVGGKRLGHWLQNRGLKVEDCGLASGFVTWCPV